MDPELAKLWQSYRSARKASQKLHFRNLLAEHYLPFVRSVAFKMAQGLPDSITVDELVSAATEGLLRSIATYDRRRRTKPETYFRPRLWGAMQDYLRHIDHLPRSARVRCRAVTELAEQLGREPIDSEIAAHLTIPIDEVKHYRRILATISIETPMRHDRYTVASTLVATEDVTQENREAVAHLMRGCNRRERLLLTMYYLQSKTMAQVGQHLGLSESRVSQIHSALIARLKARAA